MVVVGVDAGIPGAAGGAGSANAEPRSVPGYRAVPLIEFMRADVAGQGGALGADGFRTAIARAVHPSDREPA